MRLFRLTLTALAGLWGGFMYAQETTGFYGVKGDKRQFNLTARTFQLKPDDRVEFSKVRVTIWSADGSRTSAPYTNIEYFTFENPLPTLYRPSYLNANDFENESILLDALHGVGTFRCVLGSRIRQRSNEGRQQISIQPEDHVAAG